MPLAQSARRAALRKRSSSCLVWAPCVGGGELRRPLLTENHHTDRHDRDVLQHCGSLLVAANAKLVEREKTGHSRRGSGVSARRLFCIRLSFFGRFNKGGKTDVDSEQRVLCEADNKRQVEGMHTVQLCEKGECYLTPRASGNALTSLSSCRNNINRAQFE